MIIYGDKLAKKINNETKKIVKKLDQKPGLAVILIGDNPASKLYVSIKEKKSEEIGINFYKFLFSEKSSEQEILAKIDSLNHDKKISGIIVQLPLAKKFNTNKIIQSIRPEKDADGFHKKNIKDLLVGKTITMPPLISGTMELIKSSEQKLENKSAVIIANSHLFFNSLKAGLKIIGLKEKNIFWSKNVDEQITKRSDIIIIAIGKAKALKQEHIKKGSIIIDIGINKFEGKTVGDADFENLKEKAGFITPVPKGIGPMTVAMLIRNTVELSKK